MKELLRHCIFTPYRKGMGPVFHLYMYDLGRYDHNNKHLLGYKLVMSTSVAGSVTKPVTLFDGEDFGCSPMHGIDSDATVKALMGFLTLMPGDTDAEYFERYTTEQREYCERWAEALSCEVESQFGEDA